MNDMGYNSSFDEMFSVLFFLVIAVIAFQILKGIFQWHHNNQQPRLQVHAVVVDKRSEVQIHHNQNMASSSTTYHVTFQVASGDRMEFQVDGNTYGMLAQGDGGTLDFQGTRFHGFARER